MIVSPLDYELYSRVTGQPIPMSAAERMKMAPVVNEFTKNYTKAQNRQTMGRNILKIGALGALGAAAYYGSRNFGTPSQELGQEITETSTGSNVIQRQADNAAAVAGSDTIPDSLVNSGDQNPQQTEENAVASTTEPSQLNINTSMETGVKKPTPNIDAALERRNLPLPSEKNIRKKYSSYQATTPRKREKGLQETLVGDGSIFLSKPNIETGEDDGETIKTKAVSGFDDKGKSILNRFVKDLTGDDADEGDMENITSLTGKTAPDFENVLVSDTTNPQDASLYGAFATPLASPLNDHPDMPGGEDDIFQHGGTNTSPTTNLAYLDPKKVMAMSVVTTGNVSDVLNKELSKKTPEEKAVIAGEIEKKRTPNPLEKRRTPRSPNELAGKDQAAFEAIQAGIPQEDQDAAKSRVEQKTAAKQRKAGIKSPLTEQYYPEGVARTDIQVGGMKDRKTGLGRSVGISYTPLNGDTKVGFNMMSDPTKPQDVQTYDFSASPEAMQSLQTGEEGELGSETFGKLFNIAKKKQRGFGSLET